MFGGSRISIGFNIRHYDSISQSCSAKFQKMPQKGPFLPFLENLPILVEYSTGVEYSMGSEKIFGGQDFACLQSLFYRM